MDVDVKVGTTDETAGKYSAKKKDESMTIVVHPTKQFFFVPKTSCNILFNCLLDIHLKMYETALICFITISHFVVMWLNICTFTANKVGCSTVKCRR